MPFRDRTDAGEQLARRLDDMRREDVVVLALPRGGVPVAAEVARALGAPLDVIVVRKLGVPSQPELAMGAIGEGGVRVVNEDVVRMGGISLLQLDTVEVAERGELDRRLHHLRALFPRVDLAARTAVIVDDGIATGSTAAAACRVARAHGAARVVVAVPVAPPETIQRMTQWADEVVSLLTPSAMTAIGQWYDNFAPTSEEEVTTLLEEARDRMDRATDPWRGDGGLDEDVVIGPLGLPGRLVIPPAPRGIVVFAHGSSSSRHSPRNGAVAELLQGRGLATVLFDLLTAEEASDRDNVFDIDMLGHRLADATLWLCEQPGARGLSVGYFGASTGAAAALWAATEPDVQVASVVSRGGRPDLVGTRLAAVDAPTLLIVGGLDHVVIDLNRDAAERLHCEHRLVVVPGATHLFEEPGTLDEVARLAGDWFLRHLAPIPEIVG